MSFYTEFLRHRPEFADARRQADMGLLEPETRTRVMCVIRKAQAAGHDLRVHETYRSEARQRELFKRGSTALETVGTHHFGLAIDFWLYVNGVWVQDGGAYAFLGPLAKEHGLLWAGTWGGKRREACHVQRCTIARQRDLFAGSWYPTSEYDPTEDK